MQSDKLKLLNEIRFKEYKNKQEIISKVKSILQPEVEQAMRKLIEKLGNLDSVRLYSERLQSQKVKDKIEQKKHEKQRLREELGSEYESSEESNLYDDFGEGGMDENSSQQNELEDKANKFFMDLDQGFSQNTYATSNEPIESQQIMPLAEQTQAEQSDIPSFSLKDLPQTQLKQKFQVAGIQEEEEADDDQVSIKNNFRDKFLEHQLQLFNPLKFLGKTIKEIIGKPLDSEEEENEEEFQIKNKQEEEGKLKEGDQVEEKTQIEEKKNMD